MESCAQLDRVSEVWVSSLIGFHDFYQLGWNSSGSQSLVFWNFVSCNRLYRILWGFILAER